MTVPLAKTRLTRWFTPPRWQDKKPLPCALATSAYRLYLPCWLYSVCNCEGSTTAKCACFWQLLGLDPANYPLGRMTYDLRRLRLHGIIERIPQSHRYQLTADGLCIALLFSRTYARLLRPKLAEIIPRPEPIPSALRIAFDRLNSAIDACCQEERLAA